MSSNSCDLNYEGAIEMTKKLAHAGVIAAVLIAVSGCNTVKGLGEDIQSVGEAGEKAID